MKDLCKHCKMEITPEEIYGDWFHCLECKQDFPYQPERSKREDSNKCIKKYKTNEDGSYTDLDVAIGDAVL